MKDTLGKYYHPYPDNTSVRMYVRKTIMGIEFRMWNKNDPELWNAHGWLPYDAIVEAQKIYAGKNFDPQGAYDLDVASALLREGE